MLDVFSGNIMRFSCCFRIEKRKKIRLETDSKPKNYAKMSRVHFGQTAPFSAVPTKVPTAQRARSISLASRLLAAAALPTALAGIAAVTLGVGRVGVIVELQLQILAFFLLSEGPENKALAKAPQRA
jgi:hypothetical protein